MSKPILRGSSVRRPTFPDRPEPEMQVIEDFLGGSANNGNIDPQGFKNFELNQFFNQYLASLSGSGNDQILQMLYAILQQFSSNDDTNREDLGNLMSWLMQLNQRDYDKALTLDQRRYEDSLLQDQRKYDDPSAELARLMATGMSRDQALQMLGNQSAQIAPSAPNVGSIQPVGMHGSSQDMQNLQKVGSAINMFVSLATFGLSAYAASSTSSLQAAQQIALEQGTNAQKASANLNAALWRKQKAGASFDGLTFDQMADKYANDSELSPYLDELMATPAGYQIGSENYNTRFGNIDRLNLARMNDARRLAESLQPELIETAILNNKKTYEKIFAEIQNINADTDQTIGLFDAQLTLMQAQGELANAQAEQSLAQVNEIKERTKIVAIEAHRQQLTADDLDATALYQASVQLQTAALQNSPKYMRDFLETLSNDQAAMRSFSAFNCMRYYDLVDLAKDPELLKLHNLCEQLNLGGVLLDGVESGEIKLTKEMISLLNTFGKTQKKGLKYFGVPAPTPF